MQRWTAEVRAGTGGASARSSGEGRELARGLVAKIEIVEMGEEFFLFRKDADDACLADTWHHTLEDAMQLAELEFGVAAEEWRQATDDAVGLNG